MTDVATEKRDVINEILGVQPGSSIAAIREQLPQNTTDFQAYYDTLFQPTETSVANLQLVDRYLIAIRVASHTGSGAVVDWYTQEAASAGATDAQIPRAKDISGLSTGDAHLDAAFAHADLLATHPVDASKADLELLDAAGYSPAGIVTLSQIVAFVSYQLRFVALLRAVGELS